MTKQEAIAVAKKLKALAEKSSGGEKSVALEKLKSFCEKYNLDADEYETEQIKVSITYNNEHERSLLSNVLCMIMESDQVKGKIVGSSYVFSCTPRQFENIKDAFAYYKKAMNEYIDSFLVALVTKNGITNQKAPDVFRFDPMDDTEAQKYNAEFSKKIEEESEKTKEEPSPQQEPKESVPPTQPTQRSDEEVRRADRIQRMLMVVDVPKWEPKKKARLFLS